MICRLNSVLRMRQLLLLNRKSHMDPRIKLGLEINMGTREPQHGRYDCPHQRSMGTFSGYNANWTDPSKIGASVEATGGGNCQDIAALTFQYLREHCDPSWTICFVVNDTVKHSFATIGIPNTDDHSTVVVADAWVQFPKAVTLQNHFCNGGTITVHQQAGKKSEGAETQMSTLWDATQLPGYVEALKHSRDNVVQDQHLGITTSQKGDNLQFQIL